MEKSVKKYWPFFLIPTVGAFVIGFIIPFIEGVYLSFCKFNTIKDAEWVGFKNFIYIFTKEKTGFAAPGGFLDAFLFTGKFTFSLDNCRKVLYNVPRTLHLSGVADQNGDIAKW